MAATPFLFFGVACHHSRENGNSESAPHQPAHTALPLGKSGIHGGCIWIYVIQSVDGRHSGGGPNPRFKISETLAGMDPALRRDDTCETSQGAEKKWFSKCNCHGVGYCAGPVSLLMSGCGLKKPPPHMRGWLFKCSEKRLLPLAHWLKFAWLWANEQLTRAANFLCGIFAHFFPLCDPA